MIEFGLNDKGHGVITIGPKTWTKIACLLIVCLSGFARLEFTKIDKLCVSVHELNARVKGTETNISALRDDVRTLLRPPKASAQSLPDAPAIRN
jgi:hypothetical protein